MNRGVILYVNPYHRYLGYYAAVKLRDQYGGTQEAEEVFTRFVAQAGSDTFSTSEAGRILRSIFGGRGVVRQGFQGRGRSPGGRGGGTNASPDVPTADPDSEVEDTPEGSDDDDPAFDPILDDLGVEERHAEFERRQLLREQRLAAQAERRATRRANHARVREAVARNARAEHPAFEPSEVEDAFAQVLHCTTPLDASKVGVTSQDVSEGFPNLALTHRAPRLFRSVSGFADPAYWNMRHWMVLPCFNKDCPRSNQPPRVNRSDAQILGWEVCLHCGSTSIVKIHEPEHAGLLKTAIMRAFDRAVPGRQILDWCWAATTLSSCSYAAVAARTVVVDRYNLSIRKNRTDAIQTQKILATAGYKGTRYGGRGGYRRCCAENDEYRVAQAALGRRPDWVEHCLPLSYGKFFAGTPLPHERVFSINDRAEPSDIVESLKTHVSRRWPSGSRAPFLLNRAGLRTDQEGFGPDQRAFAAQGARGLAREALRSRWGEQDEAL